jgi:hypothetical protein
VKVTLRKMAKLFISLVLLVLFLCVPAWALVKNYLHAGPPPLPGGGTVKISSPQTNLAGVPSILGSSQVGDLCVTFNLVSLDAGSSVANFVILIGATPLFDQYVKDNFSSGADLNMVLEIKSNIGLDQITLPFSISSAVQHSSSCGKMGPETEENLISTAAFGVSQQIFLPGQPRAFPDDWYELNDTVKVMAGLDPVPFSLIMGSRDADLSLRANTSNDQLSGQDLQFLMQRPRWTILYTYVVSAMPALLLTIVLGARFLPRNKRRRGLNAEDAPKAHEVAFGIAATIVAILPLHAVLVPSAITSMTRLDIWFGFGISLLVVLSIIWMVVWASPATGHSTGEGVPGTPGKEVPGTP